MHGAMNVREFNTNTPRHLARVHAAGVPERVHKADASYVTIVPDALFDDLVAALGDKAHEIIAAHRDRATRRARAAEMSQLALGEAVA